MINQPAATFQLLSQTISKLSRAYEPGSECQQAFRETRFVEAVKLCAEDRANLTSLVTGHLLEFSNQYNFAQVLPWLYQSLDVATDQDSSPRLLTVDQGKSSIQGTCPGICKYYPGTCCYFCPAVPCFPTGPAPVAPAQAPVVAGVNKGSDDLFDILSARIYAMSNNYTLSAPCQSMFPDGPFCDGVVACAADAGHLKVQVTNLVVQTAETQTFDLVLNWLNVALDVDVDDLYNDTETALVPCADICRLYPNDCCRWCPDHVDCCFSSQRANENMVEGKVDQGNRIATGRRTSSSNHLLRATSSQLTGKGTTTTSKEELLAGCDMMSVSTSSPCTQLCWIYPSRCCFFCPSYPCFPLSSMRMKTEGEYKDSPRGQAPLSVESLASFSCLQTLLMKISQDYQLTALCQQAIDQAHYLDATSVCDQDKANLEELIRDELMHFAGVFNFAVVLRWLSESLHVSDDMNSSPRVVSLEEGTGPVGGTCPGLCRYYVGTCCYFCPAVPCFPVAESAPPPAQAPQAVAGNGSQDLFDRLSESVVERSLSYEPSQLCAEAMEEEQVCKARLLCLGDKANLTAQVSNEVMLYAQNQSFDRVLQWLNAALDVDVDETFGDSSALAEIPCRDLCWHYPSNCCDWCPHYRSCCPHNQPSSTSVPVTSVGGPYPWDPVPRPLVEE